MQNDWIYSILDYREALKNQIERDGQGRGYRTLLAKAAGCQPAYLSQILAGSVHLTPEQASSMCDFWNFSEIEGDYFLTLVYLGRAGNPALVEKLKRKLDQLRNQFEQQKASAVRTDSAILSREKLISYYLNWIPSAIHILLMLPDHQLTSNIARRLKIEESVALQILREMQDLGIATFENSRWRLTTKTLHVADENLFAPQHHRNWREKAAEYFRFGKMGDNLHYTSVYCIDKKTFLEFKELLEQAIEKSRRLAIPAPEETICCINLDWFEI